MEWPIETELEKMRIFASTYAGPIAIIRDSKQIVKVVGSAKPTIRIFTCSGHLISSFQVNQYFQPLHFIILLNLLPLQWNSGTLITMGWSDSEELICIQDDGTVLIYDMFGNFQQNFSMGQEAKDTKVSFTFILSLKLLNHLFLLLLLRLQTHASFRPVLAPVWQF